MTVLWLSREAQIKILNLENPLMLIAQIYDLTLNARELTRPMCFDLSCDARAAMLKHFNWPYDDQTYL